MAEERIMQISQLRDSLGWACQEVARSVEVAFRSVVFHELAHILTGRRVWPDRIRTVPHQHLSGRTRPGAQTNSQGAVSRYPDGPVPHRILAPPDR